MKVDRALKKIYDKLARAIADASRKEASDFDRRWEAAAAIVGHNPAQSVLATSLAKISSLRAVKVSERAGLLTFSGVPIGAIHHFIGALTSAKLPR